MVRSVQKQKNIDIIKTLTFLQEKTEFKIVTHSEVGATIEYKNLIKISIFKGGNVLIREADSKQAALHIFEILSPYLCPE